MVDLSTIHGPNYLVLSAKARQKFICAVQQSLSMGFSNISERKCMTQIVVKLQHVWGRLLMP